MAEIIVRSIKQALQEAHQAFMREDQEEHERKLEEARVLLHAMNEEHIEGEEESKIIRVMAWEQEYRLVASLTELKNLPKLIKIYEDIQQNMFLGRSQIIKKEDPFLPPGKEIYDFYRNAAEDDGEWTTELLKDALERYSTLTGGGGAGYEEMYCAQAAFQKKDYKKAQEYTCRVLKTENPWLKESAEKLMNQLSVDKEETV